MTTDYGGDEGAFIISSMMTKGVYAINDVDEFYNPIDLQLGTNGSINLIVGSDNNIVNKPDRCLSIIDNYKEQTGIYNFQVYGSNAIALSPADTNTTVYIGDAVFYSDTDYVYLTSYTKKLALVTEEIELGGSLHSLKDLKIDGEMYTGEVNITYPLNSNDLLGYAFRINSNNQTLELIKYLNASNVDDRKTQLVAHFGQGELINDPEYTFNIYNSTGTTPVTEFETTDPNANGGGDGSGGGGYWYANGNDIHFGNYGGTSQRVGIMTENPSETLDVIGTIKGTQLTDGFISINNGYITGIKSISVDVSQPYSGIKFANIAGEGTEHIWNGYASNLYGIDLLPLSFFNNDMDLSDFYTGTGAVWFDDISSNIKLSTFCNDLLDFTDLTLSNCTVTENLIANDTFIETLTASNSTLSNVTMINATASTITIVDELTVPTINATSLSVATNVDLLGKITASTMETSDMTITNKATIDRLDVLTSLNANTLTAYINKLVSDEVSTRLATVSGTLSVANMAVSNITTNMIPDTNDMLDLGSADKKWRDLYLGGNSLYLDNIVMKASGSSETKTLDIQNASLAMDFIEFRDGTTIASTHEIVSSINEGELFGDFTSFNTTINTSRLQIELFSGSFTYNYAHNIATSGNQWKIFEFKELETLPILEDGSGVDMSESKLIKRGGLPKNVQLSMVQNGRILGNNLYFSQISKTNVNEMFPIRMYDPFSDFFKNKCKTDYNLYYNNQEIEYGFKSTSKTMYFSKDTKYIQLNSIENLNTKTASSKYYDIEFIYYFKSPLYDIKFLLDDMYHQYLISNDSYARLDKAYVYDDELGSYILKVINENYGLYPRITIKKWDNSVNNTEFSDVIYTDSMGWGSPDTSTVFTRFKENGWLLKLFELTYIYIKCGYVIGEEAIVDIDLTTEYGKLTPDDLVFVNENDVVLDDGTVIENKTIVCLKKSVFESLFVTTADSGTAD